MVPNHHRSEEHVLDAIPVRAPVVVARYCPALAVVVLVALLVCVYVLLQDRES